MSAKLGQANVNAILTTKDVREIWKKIKQGFPYTIIAENYEASPSAIGRIGRGETWTQVTGLKEKSYRKGGPKNAK